MATTPHLGITLVEQAQAQKEVTVNQAFARIDALLNTGAKSRVIATPPGSPAAGDLYIVAASPTGSWAGQAGKITYFDGIWRFITPIEGMILWVNDENLIYSYDGSAWILANNPTEFQNLTKLGVNATADTTNKLAVASSAILFNHNGAGIQTKLNKNSASDTASVLYQTGTSGRAEFGTIGDDNFTMKVSSNGSSWLDAIKIIAATGRVAFKSIATSVSAAGSTQGTATALTKSFNEITTVASGQGVVLPSPEAGEIIMVANQGANALNIYPATGHSINNLSANTAQSLATDTRKIFFATGGSKWYSL
ncbi:MAG: DUF2793 domain-containing protein [Pseudomonadota bacterium]